MDLRAQERPLIELWRSKSWAEAYECLSLYHGHTDPGVRGWARVMLAGFLFAESGRSALQCLSLIDEALAELGEENPREAAIALVQGMHCAQFAGDSERYARFARRARRLIARGSPESFEWHGRLEHWLAYYYQEQGNLDRAEYHLQRAAAFYAEHCGPYGEHDRLCQQQIAQMAIADILLMKGRKAAVVAMLRHVLVVDECYSTTAVIYMRARLADAEGRSADAWALHSQAMRSAEAESDYAMVLKAVHGLARVARTTGNWAALAAAADRLSRTYAEGRMYTAGLRVQLLCSQQDLKGVWA